MPYSLHLCGDPSTHAGESYLDVIQRLEPVVIEIERQKDSVCVVAHQAILRVIYGYFMAISPDKIPRIEIPLHTLIELTPMPGKFQSSELSMGFCSLFMVSCLYKCQSQHIIPPSPFLCHQTER